MGGRPEDAKVAADTKRMQCNRENSRRKKLLQTCALQRSAIDNLHRALRLAAQQDYAEALVAFTAASIAGSSALDTEIEGLQELQGACVSQQMSSVASSRIENVIACVSLCPQLNSRVTCSREKLRSQRS